MRPKKRRKSKPVSKEQERARWRNFAKMRISGAITLRDLIKHEYSTMIPRDARAEIDNAVQHLQWALNRWEK